MTTLLAPKVRFKEFVEPYMSNIIKDISDINTGKKNTQDNIKDGLYPFFVRSNTIEKINSYSYDGEAVLVAGDGVGVGKVIHYYNGKFDFHQRVYKISEFKKDQIQGKYFYYFFRKNFYDRVIRMSAKNSVDSVRMNMIADMLVTYPTLPEQAKVSSFFSQIDSLISILKSQKEELEKYKKGMMQKIFSQEIRFKDNTRHYYTKWETKQLKDITNIYDGTHQTPKYVPSGIPFYSVEHITANNFSDTKYIAKSVFERENKKVKIEKGDILMTRIGDVGTAKIIDWDVEASFYVSLALIKKNKNISSEYLAHYIGSSEFQRNLWKKTIHVAFPKKINLSDIGKCRIKLPCAEEQAKIADFLGKLDKLINHNNRQIQLLETWEKGLMQGMFM